jgi:hypothetical protein
MAKRSQKKRQRDDRQSMEIRTFAPEEFHQVALRTLEMMTNDLHFSEKKADQPSPHEPYDLVFQALKDSYSNLLDTVSAYTRLRALLRLVKQHDFLPFVSPIESSLQVSNELFYVAAMAPIDAEGDFLLEPFREELARWVKEHPVRDEKMTD